MNYIKIKFEIIKIKLDIFIKARGSDLVFRIGRGKKKFYLGNVALKLHKYLCINSIFSIIKSVYRDLKII